AVANNGDDISAIPTSTPSRRRCRGVIRASHPDGVLGFACSCCVPVNVVQAGRASTKRCAVVDRTLLNYSATLQPSAGQAGHGGPCATVARVSERRDDYRIEHDSMGDVKVPADARWGAQTQRAVENFPISGLRIERGLISALAQIKGAAAMVNARLKIIDRDVARAIADAADEVATGAWDDHFPIDVYQTGSGTSSNMNMNEVLANLASESLGRDVHPNDHVNASQSSNDVFPS